MDGDPNRRRLRSVEIDETSLAPASRDVQDERQVAVFDLVEANSFSPEGAPDGPYDLRISLIDNRLALDIAGGGYAKRHLLSLSPFRGVIKDYFMVCESYYEAIRHSTPSQIETLDMGRRGLHDEGSRRLRERLEGKVAVDHDTARRLFTLICALHRRN
ncbi:MAG TPA: UPF0262 family protein [Caulobacteraceae bacterium]|jgi:uncharacterized protein (UPF0262 family)|nr:UPF0262 family protein [Caulobacteraceae bacterium]